MRELFSDMLLADFDTVVDLASKEGMHVIINYHDVGSYEKEYLTKFWDLVAPRYRDRTHVAYELMNEPVKWSRDYTDEHLANVKELYDRVRGLAGHPPDPADVREHHVTTRSRCARRGAIGAAIGGGIDWTKSSVGFHPYQTAKSAPGLLTRSGNPRRQPSRTCRATRCVAMDGEEFGVQTMERLGVSWCHWMVHGPENLCGELPRARLATAPLANAARWLAGAVGGGVRGRWPIQPRPGTGPARPAPAERFHRVRSRARLRRHSECGAVRPGSRHANTTHCIRGSSGFAAGSRTSSRPSRSAPVPTSGSTAARKLIPTPG